MNAAVPSAQEEVVEELGGHFIQKPFKLADVKKWFDECSQRVLECRMLAKSG